MNFEEALHYLFDNEELTYYLISDRHVGSTGERITLRVLISRESLLSERRFSPAIFESFLDRRMDVYFKGRTMAHELNGDFSIVYEFDVSNYENFESIVRKSAKELFDKRFTEVLEETLSAKV